MWQFKIHPDFCLNGIKLSSKDDVLNFVKSKLPDSHNFLDNWFSDNQYMSVQTSGSTGKPKSIQILKMHMINSAKATGIYFDLKPETTALLCLSTDYIAGKMMFVRALVLGWHLDVIAPKSRPLKSSKQYDFTAMVPMQVQQSLQDLYKVKQLIIGGGKVSNDLLFQLQSISVKAYATYGMTETVTHIAIKKLNHCHIESSNFTVLPQVKISIDNRQCLVIDAPEIANDTIVTNDIVEIISDKQFKWLGRFDTVINSGAVKIIPEQVEQKLTKLIKQRFFIASEKDVLLGEKVILIIEGKNHDEILSDIQNNSNLSKYEMPKAIYFLEQFVETKTQKISRKETLKFVK
jgi:O-succinylbenzoic acid--CoA ligase